MPNFSFSLNGAPCEVEAEADTPLLYVLRDQLSLNGPRYGCGLEQCGACRVIVDGQLAWACTRRIEDAAGTEITTVEGLATDQELHPLQQAFLEFNAAQCGYCTSGILMSAYALLQSNRNPDRAQIQEALADNLCRCGAHNRMIKAVQRAAEIMRAG